VAGGKQIQNATVKVARVQHVVETSMKEGAASAAARRSLLTSAVNSHKLTRDMNRQEKQNNNQTTVTAVGRGFRQQPYEQQVLTETKANTASSAA
jgi:hypothetical protein